ERGEADGEERTTQHVRHGDERRSGIMPCALCAPSALPSRMARSPLMQRLQAIVHAHDPAPSPSRRRFLPNAGAFAAQAGLPNWSAAAVQARVVIVGAGLAGLAAAYTLAKAGVRATLYEGSPRIGGRCWTDRETFADGQVAERGGELIDTSHEEIRALCTEFGLPLDDL